MQHPSTDRRHPQFDDFDFPCSASFRQFFHDPNERARRRHLPSLEYDERGLLWRQEIEDLETENFRLRVALDLARLALGQRGSTCLSSPSHAAASDNQSGFEGIQGG